MKIVKRGSIVASPDIFNIQLLFISWLWTLLGSGLRMILMIKFPDVFRGYRNATMGKKGLISCFVNLTFVRYWSVMRLMDQGETLLFSIEHCFVKRELKISVFLRKSVTNLWSTKSKGCKKYTPVTICSFQVSVTFQVLEFFLYPVN